MTRISLVVSDVDGTLLTTDKRLTPATLAAVATLREQGILFAITSSRPGYGMKWVIEALRIDLPVGPFNGSSIIGPDLSVIEQSTVPMDAVRQSLALFETHAIDVWVFTNSEWLIARDDGYQVAREARTIATAPRLVGDFGDSRDRACKVVGVSGDRALLENCERELAAQLGDTAHVARSQHYYLDVTPPGLDKGTFVEALAGRLGIPLSEVATIGDMPNDVPMFAKSGYSFAMGEASETVKARAKDVTDGNDADGFAKAMQKLLRVAS